MYIRVAYKHQSHCIGKNITRSINLFIYFHTMALFNAETHTYTIDGCVVPRSVTALVKTQFPFNAPAIIAANYSKWKESCNPKYAEFCRGTDAEGKAAIAAHWAAKGERAAKQGTALHEWAETWINLKRRWAFPTVPAFIPDQPREASQVVDFTAFAETNGLNGTRAHAYAAELIVWWKTANGRVALAGTIDALFKDAHMNYHIVDWKRTAERITGARLKQYSLQLSIYSLLLKQSRNIDVGDNLYLVRVAPDIHSYELTKCSDLRGWARLLLDAC